MLELPAVGGAMKACEIHYYTLSSVARSATGQQTASSVKLALPSRLTFIW